MILPSNAFNYQQMRQTEPAQRRLLQGIGTAAQPFTQYRPAIDDIVVARVNDVMVHDTHGQTLEQRLQTGLGVRAHMRRQPITQRIGQPVDEGRVAEMVLPAPVVAVGFEGVETVGAEDDGAAAGGGWRVEGEQQISRTKTDCVERGPFLRRRRGRLRRARLPRG